MKLTPEQINQIIEGLENRKTKLIATNIYAGVVTNVITKIKKDQYKNTFGISRKRKKYTVIFKNDLLADFKDEEIRHTFELVTTNEDKSETRIKI